MKTVLIVLTIIGSAVAVDLIQGFHFHTYFLQRNKVHVEEIKELRKLIENEIENGVLHECSLNKLNMEPLGPHPIGSFETCCNATSLDAAVSFFMQNRRHFSVLLHPLTTEQLVDHRDRAMWMGMPQQLDLGFLQPVLLKVDTCHVRITRQ